MLYYVFDDKKTALNAEAYISQIGRAPRTGVNSLTKEPAPDKCKTERWAVPQERLDGKWIFPYVGDEALSKYPSEIIDNFNTNYPHVKEEYGTDWFPHSTISKME